MNNERMLYISPEDDLPAICTRLEHAHCRKIILVLPAHAEHLHAFGTWRMLHAYTRRSGIRVHIVSTNPYYRSVARSARFTVTKTLDEPLRDKPIYTKPAPRMSSSLRLDGDAQAEREMDVDVRSDGTAATHAEQAVPPVLHIFDLASTPDDMLSPPRPGEPPVRVSKPPRPLDMPRVRRTRPLALRRLPWDDDVDDEMLPPQPAHPPIRRRTNPLVRSMTYRRGSIRNIPRRKSPSPNVVSLAPILCIGIFIVVRSIVQYVRGRTL